jgi:hypothetical protein
VSQLIRSGQDSHAVSSHPSGFLDEVRLLGTALGLDIRAALQKPFKAAEFVDSITG